MARAEKLWRAALAAQDLMSAAHYLSLLYRQASARQMQHSHARARTLQATAKDLLRASNLPLLPRGESHVKADLKRLRKRKALAPGARGIPLVIADGYRRICAACYFDEDAAVAYRLTARKR